MTTAVGTPASEYPLEKPILLVRKRGEVYYTQIPTAITAENSFPGSFLLTQFITGRLKSAIKNSGRTGKPLVQTLNAVGSVTEAYSNQASVVLPKLKPEVRKFRATGGHEPTELSITTKDRGERVLPREKTYTHFHNFHTHDRRSDRRRQTQTDALLLLLTNQFERLQNRSKKGGALDTSGGQDLSRLWMDKELDFSKTGFKICPLAMGGNCAEARRGPKDQLRGREDFLQP